MDTIMTQLASFPSRPEVILLSIAAVGVVITLGIFFIRR